jgi:hypothetical protein
MKKLSKLEYTIVEIETCLALIKKMEALKLKLEKHMLNIELLSRYNRKEVNNI